MLQADKDKANYKSLIEAIRESNKVKYYTIQEIGGFLF